MLFSGLFGDWVGEGLYDTGLAYDVMEKARQGYYPRNRGVDGITASVLMASVSVWISCFFRKRSTTCSPRLTAYLT